MSEEALFTRRAAAVLAWSGGIALALTLAYIIFGEPSADVRSAGADSFSRSALGHRALVELLGKEVPVVVSRRASGQKATASAPLLLLEPPADPQSLERLARMLHTVRGRGAAAVVVLPKWRGFRDEERQEWVSRVELLSDEAPRRVLRAVSGDDSDLTVRRPREPLEASVHGGYAVLPYPQLLSASTALEQVTWTGQGTLVARLPESRIYVVSDPDLLNTAGLARGENARVVHQLFVEELDPQAFILDETLHGFRRSDSVWRALLEFPLICVTLHLLTLLAFVLWATTRRFGRPLPPPSRLPPGKLTLLENTARLLTSAANSRYALEKYLNLSVHSASELMALPASLSHPARIERLGRLGDARGLTEDLRLLVWEVERTPPEETSPRHTLRLANALYRWRREFSRQERRTL